jgi:hypothetical protein
MKKTSALWIPLVLALAACGSGKQQGTVAYRGTPPYSAAQKAKDNRTIQTFCPKCKQPLDFGSERCSQKVCKELRVGWRESYTCWTCDGSGRCQACVMREQRDGKCSNCKGSGILTFQGRTPECPDCKGKGTCALCGGTQKCDYCEGGGKVSADLVKQRAKRAGTEDEPAPTPKPEPAAPAPPAPAPPPPGEK